MHLEHAVSQADGCPWLTKAGGMERNRHGVRSPCPNHTRVAKIVSLWTRSALSLGAPVKHQFLQERIRQKSMCSHILTLLAVTVQHRVVTHSWADVQAAPHLSPLSVHPHHPLPCLCFQARRYFLIHSRSQWEPSLLLGPCPHPFNLFFWQERSVFPEWLSQHALWTWGRERRSPAYSLSPSFLAFPKLPTTMTSTWTTSTFGEPASHTSTVSSLTYPDVGFMFYTTGKS